MTVETPPGSNLEYTRLKAEEAVAPGTDASRRCATRTPPSARRCRAGAIGGPGAGLRAPHAQGGADASARRSWAHASAREMARLGGAQVSVFTSGFGGALKSIQVADDAGPMPALDLPGGARGRRRCGRSRARWTSASPRGARSPSSRSSSIEARRVAGDHGGPGGAVAAAGVRGDRRGRLGRSDRRDPRRDGAPGARVRAERVDRPRAAAAGGGHQPPGGRPTMLPLGQVATIRQGLGPAQIDHLEPREGRRSCRPTSRASSLDRR